MRWFWVAVAALAVHGPAWSSVACAGAKAPTAGFRALFDGVSLDGWWGLDTVDPASWQSLPDEELARRRDESRADLARHWRVDDGVLVNDGQGLYLTTVDSFADFELHLEYATVAVADSGIYLRGVPQVQIWDTTEAGGKWSIGADKGSGGLWNNSPGAPGKDPLVHADRPFGEWNQVRVVMVGERVSVWLNDRLVVDHARLENYFDRARPIPRRGPVQLQTHGGEIRWRNVRVRDIESVESNRILAAHGDAGFAPIFDGVDLEGFAGPIEDYVIEDGVLSCRPGRGGTIHTVDEYSDFAMRLEIRLPPGGNNGLAIRYPGTGDAAYTGMCELQVLDDDDPRYARLDPRQYHGSAYGQVAAHRGYQRPTGEWNLQEVTVRGSRITVELNGTRILDADIGAADDLLYEPERFAGRGRARGHLGFCGHGDAVEFRDVRVRRLEESSR